MQELRHHSASVLITPAGSLDSVVLGVYGNTYPIPFFNGHFTFLGGSASGESSPRATLEREVKEELGLCAQHQPQSLGSILGLPLGDTPPLPLAVPSNHQTLREALSTEILRTAEGYADYVVSAGVNVGGRRYSVTFMISVYRAEVEQGLFEEAAALLGNGKQLSNEGLVRVATVDQLRRGVVRGAWGYATIAGQMLGTPLPEYDLIQVVSLGSKPQASFRDYRAEFSYARDPEVIVRTQK